MNDNELSNELKVASKTKPGVLAGAIAEIVRRHECAKIQAVGAGALNQAVKAVTIARGFVAPCGIDLVIVPAFVDVEINGRDMTAMQLNVEAKQ